MLEVLKDFYKEKCETPGAAVPFGGQSPLFPKVDVIRKSGETVLYPALDNIKEYTTK